MHEIYLVMFHMPSVSVSHRTTDTMSPTYTWSARSSLLDHYGSTHDRAIPHAHITVAHVTPAPVVLHTRDTMRTCDVKEKRAWTRNSK